MNLPINHELTAESILNNSSTESIRNELTLKIEINDNLTDEQKENALDEMDLLLGYEKYRRMLRMLHQLKAERRDRINSERDRIRTRRESLISKRQEYSMSFFSTAKKQYYTLPRLTPISVSFNHSFKLI